MPEDRFPAFELKIFEKLEARLGHIHDEKELYNYIESVVKSQDPSSDKELIDRIVSDAKTFDPINKYLLNSNIEDIMVNNTENVFVYDSVAGDQRVNERISTSEELDWFVKKLKMYATSTVANRHIFDVHLPNGSRCNIVDSPLGPDITIRNFKPNAFSIIDLVNGGELSFQLAARYWLYSEGLGIRPANMIIGGMPGSGKSTLLNAMFSFFRPEARIVVLEETYEINTSTQENCVRLETSPELTLEDLLKNALRMRPDLIIVGETRGREAEDMMTAMSIGKSVMTTMHAHTTRDMVTRLEHEPMKISRETIPLIDVFSIVTQVDEDHKKIRKVTQVSESSGMETQVLMSDLYMYDYKTRTASNILPSITYRDVLSKASGRAPPEIIQEENRRAKVLQKLNEQGVRDLRSINEFCKEYYDDQRKALQKLGLQDLGTFD